LGANQIRRFKLRISAEHLLAERQGLAYNCGQAAENLSDFCTSRGDDSLAASAADLRHRRNDQALV
jgi:hypothetical protein